MKYSLILLIVVSLVQMGLSQTEYKNQKGQSLDYESISICQRECTLSLMGVPQYADKKRTVFRCCQKVNFNNHSVCIKTVPTACDKGNISKNQKLVLGAKIPAVHEKKQTLKSINL